MSDYARRSTPQPGQATATVTRRRQAAAPAGSTQAIAQARFAGLAQGSAQALQLRALQARADARQPAPGMAAVQRFGGEEDELQMRQARFADTVQCNGVEEEEPLQGRFAATAVQRDVADEEEPAQMEKASGAADRSALPDPLKAGIENLSGLSMDKVRVHYNSAKPATLNALAYAQGSDIHVAAGQERHLPHEAWHVVQQAQGRVKPTMQLRDDVPVNDDPGLEQEADEMGARALKT